MNSDSAFELSRAFAAAQNQRNWRAVAALLAPDCRYSFRNTDVIGAESIVAIHRSIGD